jgi:GNAT superfamily N-acetyltransferase
MSRAMNTAELLALFDCEQRRDIAFYGSRRSVTPRIVRQIPEPGYGGNGYVLYSNLREADADRAIEEEIAFFTGLGIRFGWKLYGHDLPADLGARLAARGFIPQEIESVVVLDLDEAPADLWQPIAADLRRVTDPAQIAEVVAVQDAVWGERFDWLGAQLAQELQNAGDDFRLYLAYAEGTAASTAWVRFHPPTRFASLWGGSTLADYRGRGLYTALLAARAQEARRRGVRFLTVDASDMSRPILERRGFRFLTTARDYKWPSEQGAR